MFRRNEIETAYAPKFAPNKDKFSRPHSREHCSVNADEIRMMELKYTSASSHRKATENGITLALGSKLA